MFLYRRRRDTDEIYPPPAGPAVYVIEDFGKTGLQVTGIYAAGELAGGVWSIGLAPLDEDAPWPDWPMHWSADGYTPRLSLTVPDTATIRHAGTSRKPR